MMLTFLLPVTIFVPAVLMLWHAYTRACRNYIERHQPDAGIIAASSAGVSDATGAGSASLAHSPEPYRSPR